MEESGGTVTKWLINENNDLSILAQSENQTKPKAGNGSKGKLFQCRISTSNRSFSYMESHEITSSPHTKYL